MMTLTRTSIRKYEASHPWIKFEVDLKRASAKFWMLLGEARSKCEHIAQVPLQPRTAKEMHQLYLAKGALATTAIEGNTLSEKEVIQHLEGKLELPPSKQYLAKEIDNVVNACNWILQEIVRGETPTLSAGLIKSFNGRVLNGLKVDEGVIPGEIRTYSVGVARYRAAPAQDCEYLLQRTCEWLDSALFDSVENDLPQNDLAMPIIKAVLAHLYLAWIHPFGDGNGRTARLIEFLILVTSGLPSPAAHLLSNHYNQTRTEYYRLLDGASKTEQGIISFMEYAVSGLVDGLRAQLDLVRKQQFRVIWNDYVHEKFREHNTPADTRRRHLVLDISKRDKAVSISKLRELTPRVAAAYATKGTRTLSRDLKILESMGLINIQRSEVMACRELILAFLPVRGPGQVAMTDEPESDEDDE
jgi:cell filamentation protein, protein adenylyltransferase